MKRDALRKGGPVRRAGTPGSRPLEGLEERTLLSSSPVPGHDLPSAVPLQVPADLQAGTVAPDAPVFYRITPTADSRLLASVHADTAPTRLSLLDSIGNLLVQSDGQSPANPDDLIDQHLAAGTFFLEVQSLGDAGGYTISTDLTASSQPFAPALTVTPPPPSPIPLPPPGGLPSPPANPTVPTVPSSSTPATGAPPSSSSTAAPPSSSLSPTPAPTLPGPPSPPPPPPAPPGAATLPPPPKALDLVYGKTLVGPPVVFGDFRGNGTLDYASSDGIHLGLGDGTFQTSALPLTGLFTDPADLTAMAAAKLGGGSDLDLVAAGYDPSAGTNDYQVLMGRGDGTFLALPPVPLGSFVPYVVSSGSFTGGGHVDVALAGTDESSGEGRLLVLPGRGDGTFGPALATDLGQGFYPTSLVAADFNQDGRSDLAVAGYVKFDTPPTPPSWLLPSTSSPGSPLPPPPPPPPPPAPIVPPLPSTSLLPSPADDEPQSATAVQGYGVVTILLGNGDGSFGPSRQSFYTSWPVKDLQSDGLIPLSLTAGDFAGSGRTDLAFVEPGMQDLEGAFVLLPGRGDGTFDTPRMVLTPSMNPHALVVGDLAGDGQPDFLAGGRQAFGKGGYLQLLVNTGQGAYTLTRDTSQLSVDPHVMAAGDFTGSGRTDIVVEGPGGPSDDQQVQVYTGLGSSGESLIATASSLPDYWTAFTYGSTLVATGDFNGDGRLDVIRFVSNQQGTSGEVDFFPGTGNGSFGDPVIIDRGDFDSVLDSDSNIAVGDFTGSGHLDVAVFTRDGSHAGSESFSSYVSEAYRLELILGNGDGTFQAPVRIGLGQFQPSEIVTGNFRGDGHREIAMLGTMLDPARPFSVTRNNVLEVLRINGDGTVESPDVIPLGSDAVSYTFNTSGGASSSIVAADLFGNGRDDLAILRQTVDDPADGGSSLGVEILPGQPDGTFAAPMFVHLGDVSPIGTPALVAGDFNGDGHLDLAVLFEDFVPAQFPPVPFQSSNNTYELRVLLGRGDGTFEQLRQTYSTNLQGIRLATGDFNGDGHLDLAAVGDDHSGLLPNAIDVLLGNGDGTFQEPIRADTIPGWLPWVFGDFNGTGRTDLAFDTVNKGIDVADALGDGRFAAPSDYAATIHNTPVVADVTGDGTSDVFVTDQAGEILWRRGRPGEPGSFDPPIVINPGDPSRDFTVFSTGRGTMIASVQLHNDSLSIYTYSNGQFDLSETLPTGGLPAQVLAADLTGSGILDLVVRNAVDGTASVYLGDGWGNFLRQADVPIGSGATDIALVDLGGTGRADLVVTDGTTGTLYVLASRGDGTFGAPRIYDAGKGPYGMSDSAGGTPVLTSQERTAGAAPVPGPQGDPPGLAVINPGTNSLAVLDALGGGALANPIESLTTTPAEVIRSGDFNGDGVTDLAVLSPDGVSVFLGDGRGGFSPPTTYDAGLNPTGLTIARLTENGPPDILVGNGFGDVLVLVNDGHGGFEPYHKVDQQIALAAIQRGPGAAGSFVFADRGRDQVAVSFGGQSGPQPIGDRSQGVLAPGAVTVADLNGDGIPDLIVANSGSNDVLVYLGQADGTYAPARAFPVGTDPVGVTVADLTGDGIPDLVVTNKGSNDVSVLIGQGSGSNWTFSTSQQLRFKAGYGPSSAVVKDVFGNGKLDLVVTDSQSNQVRILPGLANGFFNDANPIIFNTGIDPGAVLVGNFSGAPGQVDLLTVNAGSNDLTLITGIDGTSPDTQDFPSGGLDPVAAIEGNFGGAGDGLLVANEGDGRLALFLIGPEGLQLSQSFEEAGLPHPTALAMDGSGNIFGGTEGIEAAIPIILGLGVDNGGGSQGILSLPTSQPATVQVALLQPLRESSLAIVATLLSVTVESPSVEPATEMASPTQALAQAAIGAGTAGSDEPGVGQAAPAPAQDRAVPADLARFIAGVDEEFAAAGIAVRRGSPLAAAAPHPQSVQRALRLLDEVLSRWSPVLNSLGPTASVMIEGLARVVTTAAARGAEAAPEVSDRQSAPTGAAEATPEVERVEPVSATRSASPPGAAGLGWIAVIKPLAELIRPPGSRPTMPVRYRRKSRPRQRAWA